MPRPKVEQKARVEPRPAAQIENVEAIEAAQEPPDRGGLAVAQGGPRKALLPPQIAAGLGIEMRTKIFSI